MRLLIGGRGRALRRALHLDGGVDDVEVRLQRLPYLTEHRRALAQCLVLEGDVAGEGVDPGAELPDVQVVDRTDPGGCLTPASIDMINYALRQRVFGV